MKRVTGFTLWGILLFASPAFAQNHQTGAVLEDAKEYEKIPLAMTPARGNLPVAVDLSDRFPAPGDQGNQGSCVGWAVAYALKSYQEKVERRWPGNAPSYQFSPAFIYNQIKHEGGGAYISEAMDFLVRNGAVSLEQFPYHESDDNRMPSSSLQSAAREYAIAAWRRIDLTQTSDTRNHLASGFPVVIGMKVSKSFHSHQGGTVYSYNPAENDDGSHAMCVVGYDDNRRAVKLINSWGKSWGDGGFAWVSYDTFLQKVREAYVAQDVVVNRPGDLPDPKTIVIEQIATPDSPWVFPDSSRRSLTAQELRVCSAYQLWRARNEIYARHGFQFSSQRGKDYAKQLGNHYRPVTADSDAVEAQFNAVEQYNIAMIISFEHGRPNPVGPLPSNPWVFADSSARRITASEVQRLSAEQRWRARNEIFARNGYQFQTERGKALCRSIGNAYRPVSADMNVISARLNLIEHYNVALIQRFE